MTTKIEHHEFWKGGVYHANNSFLLTSSPCIWGLEDDLSAWFFGKAKAAELQDCRR